MNQKHEKRRMKHLGRKVNILVTGLQIISIVAAVVLCICMFYSLVQNMLQEQCINGTNMLAYQLEHYAEDGDKTQLLDDLKEQMGCEFTIFHGDERAYTTIMQDGKRAVGTKLSKEIAAEVLEKGKAYVGTAPILGVNHLCSYVPTKDADGKVDGLIFAGISMNAASSQTSLTIKLSCIVGGLLIILGIIVTLLFVARFISRPLSEVTALAQMIDEGKLGIGDHQTLSIDVKSNDEIGFLAETFGATIQRLKAYIGEISQALSAISEGDLTVQTTQDYVGDFSSIKQSLEHIIGKLNSTMSQIMESSDRVSDGSEQMSTAAQGLSQGATEQASAVDELNTTMREISQQVGQTAQNAQQANQQVENVGERIRESNQKMQEMIHAMEEITESSNEIEKILKTIDTIAFQTNILALNSAVEAARAGEAGKGFAVVAEEVRELAGKSSEAAQSTAELIERSIAAVEYGTRIANETAEQLISVVTGAAEIESNTNQIAQAAVTQADSVSQVQERIGHIAEVVQTNSATAEESAATSEELSSQAALLKNLINMFHLKRP